jgi:hypothetical protein
MAVITKNGFSLPLGLGPEACPVYNQTGPSDLWGCPGGFDGSKSPSDAFALGVVEGRVVPAKMGCGPLAYRTIVYYREIAAMDPNELASRLAQPTRVPPELSQAPEVERMAAGLSEASRLVSIAQAALVRFGIPPITHASEVAISQG